MVKTLLLGAASILMPGRKAKIVLVGLQFGYLAYKILQNKNKTEHVRVRR
ncbi:hypothetical protein [Bizionia myxarmorum]|nr:hypothetical protein [Bizionia myxarmorum]